MWNPFKTLAERDSERLRAISKRLDGVEDDLEQLLNVVPKLNARLRQRARREFDATTESDTGPGEVLGGLSHGASPSVRLDLSSPSSGEGGPISPVSKDVLRARARAKGLMR